MERRHPIQKQKQNQKQTKQSKKQNKQNHILELVQLYIVNIVIDRIIFHV